MIKQFKLDLLLVNAPSRLGVYGPLSEFTAIEQPVWAGLIARYCLNRGYSVEILDAEALGLNIQDTAIKIMSCNPRLAVFCIYGHQPSASTQCLPAASAVAKIISKMDDAVRIPTLALGTHMSALPEKTLREEPFDFVCQGEGPHTVAGLLNELIEHQDPHMYGYVKGLRWKMSDGSPSIIFKPSSNIENLDQELPNQAWELLDMKRYRPHHWHRWMGNPNGGYAAIQTSLGCPYSCLRGDTLVNTLYGDIPIEVLAKSGEKSIPVYTYKDGEVVIADAIHIKKLGSNKKLVRVAFDDSTYIDCTPDHKFLTFTINTPQNGDVTETAVEAQFLESGDRIRAVAIRHGTTGRKTVEWRRRGVFNAIMIMEYLLKRKLKKGEKVHHDDHDPSNDLPNNLILCNSWLDHIKNHHPEVSKRMTVDNPMFKKETRKKVSVTAKKNVASGTYIPFMCTTKGKKVISRIARHRALTDNPMKKSEIAMAPALRRSRSLRMKRLWANRDGALEALGRKEINHHVISVTPLTERDDVYCMEVPGYGWFFANNVLVKNCTFCCINTPFGGSGYRMWSPANVAAQIANLVNRYSITNLKFPDEMFVLNRQHVWQICNHLIDMGLGDQLNIWAYARIDTVKDQQLLDHMRKAGFKDLGIGIESASKHVRDGVEKGRFGNEQILEAIARVRAAGIYPGCNYIFGLMDDTEATMQETLDLACEINGEYSNFYCAQAYPGSPLHTIAKQKGWLLPEDTEVGWAGYSQHNYQTLPLPTDTLTAAEVLEFRDNAWLYFHQRPTYLNRLKKEFGQHAVEDMKKMISYGKPKRKLLGD